MKFSFLILVVTATAISATPHEKRQSQSSATANDFIENGCKDVIFFWARALTEYGNIGSASGAVLRPRLAARFNPSFAMQGINYPIYTNSETPGYSQKYYSTAAQTMITLLSRAATECTGSSIIAGGYSHGAAITAEAVSKLPDAVKDRINGIVLFGYMLNKLNNGTVPGFAKEKLKMFCNTGDLVCDGQYIIRAPHLTYFSSNSTMTQALQFLAEKVGGV